jgi:hypothetical protein
MNTRRIFAIAALGLATAGAFAQVPTGAPQTQNQVESAVLAARAAGTLTPAGEGVTPGYPTAADQTSTVSRAAVDAATLEARTDGLLIPPSGQMSWQGIRTRAAATPPSTLTRDAVKDQVLAARAAGTLIPAGEGEYSGAQAELQMAHHAAPSDTAVAANHAH